MIPQSENPVNHDMKNISSILPARLKTLRQNRNRTQAQFARDLEVNQQTYANWELGNREPNLDTLMWIAIHFNVTTDWLLGMDRDAVTSQQNEKLCGRVAAFKSRVDETKKSCAQLLETISKLDSNL